MNQHTIRRTRGRTTALLLGVGTSLALVLASTTAASAATDPDGIDVYVTFEGYNLGQGYYIEPLKLTVPDGTTAAEVTLDVLEDAGKDAQYSGEPTAGGYFYLSGVSGFDTYEVDIPDYITSQPDFQLTEENGDGYLSEFDYSSMSGWMYTVDNVMAPVGAADWELADGEVMRWQFTVHGYGQDLGVPYFEGAEAFFTMADKSQLIRAIADPDPETATVEEVAAARGVAIDPVATEPQVAAALSALTTSGDGSGPVPPPGPEQPAPEQPGSGPVATPPAAVKPKATVVGKGRPVVKRSGSAKQRRVVAKIAADGMPRLKRSQVQVRVKGVKKKVAFKVNRNGRLVVRLPKGLKPGNRVLVIKLAATETTEQVTQRIKVRVRR